MGQGIRSLEGDPVISIGFYCVSAIAACLVGLARARALAL